LSEKEKKKKKAYAAPVKIYELFKAFHESFRCQIKKDNGQKFTS
jgi:hypothetical protein